MTVNNAYHDKMQAQLKEIGAKLELYKAKAVTLGAEARVEIEKEIQKLQPVRDNLQGKLEAAKTAGAEKWEEIKASFEKAWTDLSANVEDIAHRLGLHKHDTQNDAKNDAKNNAKNDVKIEAKNEGKV